MFSPLFAFKCVHIFTSISKFRRLFVVSSAMTDLAGIPTPMYFKIGGFIFQFPKPLFSDKLFLIKQYMECISTTLKCCERQI